MPKRAHREPIRDGDCVRLPDGRIARVRGLRDALTRVRVKRWNGDTHQFLLVERSALKLVQCPKGRMSRDGYRRYLRVTLRRMRARTAEMRK